MGTAVFTERITDVSRRGSFAETALKASARLWFLTAVVGQWLFLYYIVAFYGPSTFQGNFQAWSRNKFLFKGYVAGDTAGNLAFAAHALLAGIIAFGGALQLIPQIRARAPWIHRWNGRVFLVTALAVSISGLYMVWVRGATQNMMGALGVSLNAVLIILFAVVAWRTAVTRDIAAHRRWALRTYIVANGQWFIRVGMVAWMILNHGRDGGFYRYWNFGCYLLPLAVLELYLRAKEGSHSGGRLAVAGGLVGLTLVMGLGIVGAAAFLWQQVLRAH
jgi:uncharacterized membrane protein